MDNKDKAYWLADKIPAYGDYAVEASILLKSQADEIERCQSWIKDCVDNVLYPLSFEPTKLGIRAEGLGQESVSLLQKGANHEQIPHPVPLASS